MVCAVVPWSGDRGRRCCNTDLCIVTFAATSKIWRRVRGSSIVQGGLQSVSRGVGRRSGDGVRRSWAHRSCLGKESVRPSPSIPLPSSAFYSPFLTPLPPPPPESLPLLPCSFSVSPSLSPFPLLLHSLLPMP